MEPKIAKIVCRTCLIDDDLVEVFSDTGLELSLILKLKEHLKLEVSFSMHFGVIRSLYPIHIVSDRGL